MQDLVSLSELCGILALRRGDGLPPGEAKVLNQS